MVLLLPMTLLSYCSCCKKAQVVLLLSLFSCKILERILIKAIGCPSRKHYIVSRCQKQQSLSNQLQIKNKQLVSPDTRCLKIKHLEIPQRLFDCLSHRSSTFRFGCSCSNSPPRPRVRSSTNSLLCGVPEMFQCRLCGLPWGRSFKDVTSRVVPLDKSDNGI